VTYRHFWLTTLPVQQACASGGCRPSNAWCEKSRGAGPACQAGTGRHGRARRSGAGIVGPRERRRWGVRGGEAPRIWIDGGFASGNPPSDDMTVVTIRQQCLIALQQTRGRALGNVDAARAQFAVDPRRVPQGVRLRSRKTEKAMTVFSIWESRFPPEHRTAGREVTEAIWRDMQAYTGYLRHVIAQRRDEEDSRRRRSAEPVETKPSTACWTS
jgi:hypothetical protein